jgi:hypothetical protein
MRNRSIYGGRWLPLVTICGILALAAPAALRAQSMSDGTNPEPSLRAPSGARRCTYDRARLDDALRRFEAMDGALEALRPLLADVDYREITQAVEHIARLRGTSEMADAEVVLRTVRGARQLGSAVRRGLRAAPHLDRATAAERLALEGLESLVSALQAVEWWGLCVPALQAPKPPPPPSTCFVGAVWRRGDWQGRVSPERQRANLQGNAERAGVTGEVSEYVVPGGHNLLAIGCKLAAFKVVDTSGGEKKSFDVTFTVTQAYVFDGTYRAGNMQAPEETKNEAARTVDILIKTTP